uniref:Antitoxin HicB n=1 Tax=Candidatus Kentrum sp. DK TaxID=2126562 RepID=A0A450RUW5_9GAMM|nr:MAG: antitoxin HicB [Candidatus Kentron sp. DK]
MKQIMNYPLALRPLMEDEGGGWLVSFPDLPGCLSDGETPEEALANGKDALSAWLRAAEETGREIPHPGELPSGKFITRVPRTLHACLAARARQEGVSMNALVSTLILRRAWATGKDWGSSDPLPSVLPRKKQEADYENNNVPARRV